jgi:hypothetical protein
MYMFLLVREIAHTSSQSTNHWAVHRFEVVIAFGGVVGSAVPLFVAVPLVPDVDVAWSGVGSVFTPGTPVAPPWVACAGVGLVFTPGTPVAPPWAPVVSFCCASAKVLDSAKAVANAIVVSFMFVSSWVESRTNRLAV